MSNSFLRRQDVGYPQQPNPDDIYAVKIIEAASPAELQTAVNIYLFNLPEQAPLWIPHVVDTQMLIYGTGGNTTFVMKITLYISGTVTVIPVS